MPSAHPPLNQLMKHLCLNVALENLEENLDVAMFLNLVVRMKPKLGEGSLK